MTAPKTCRTCVAAAVLAAMLPITAADAGSKKPLKVPSLFDVSTRKKTKTNLGPRLAYSGYVQLSAQHENNRDLDASTHDRKARVKTVFGLALRANLGAGVVGFAHGAFSVGHKAVAGYGSEIETRARLKEAFVSMPLSGSTRITTGRMRFSDLNKWMADAAVDGVHLGWRAPGRAVDFAIVSGTHNTTSDYVIAHASRATKPLKQGMFAIFEQDGAQDRLHVSFYRNQTVSARFEHQWNVALVAGDAANGRDAGIAVDWRGIRKLDGARKPQLSVGFALGTSGYQQTGLESHKTYAKGQTQFHRYGYVFQPELTNVAVATVSYGVRPSRKFSADLTAHIYAQPSPSNTAPVARVSGTTTGRSGFLGAEVSVTGGWRPTKKSKVEFGAAAFLPGSAYAARPTTTRLFARYTISF